MNYPTQTILPPWKALILYGIVSLFLFFEMALQVSPSVMSTQLMQDLNIGTFGLGIMSGIYFYTYTAMQIPSGILFDRYHPRFIITLSLLICTIGTLLFANTHSIYTGCAARLLIGTGSAFAFVAVLVVTADLFPSRQFALMTGITQMLAAFGAMAGQLPISLLVTHIGWRHTLWVLAGMGFILLFIIWRLLNYKKNHEAIPNTSRSSSQNQPILDNLKQIFSSKQTVYIALYACLLWTPMSSFASLWGVPFLTHHYSLTPNAAALLCSIMWMGLAIASPLLGALSTAIHNRIKPLMFSALIGSVAFSGILLLHLPTFLLAIALLFAGAACAGQALSFTVVKENNPDHIKAAAIAVNNMAVVISGAVFQPVIGKLIESNNNILHFKAGLSIVLLAYVTACFIALLFIKESKNIN